MTRPDRDIRAIGTHLVEVEGDSLEVTGRGMLTLEDLQRFLDLSSSIQREHGFVFLLYDGRQTTGVESGARKLVSRGNTNDWNNRLRVAFGLSFPVRVMFNVILRAQQLLLNREMRVHVFEHEAQARAFFKEERERIRALDRQCKSS